MHVADIFKIYRMMSKIYYLIPETSNGKHVYKSEPNITVLICIQNAQLIIVAVGSSSTISCNNNNNTMYRQKLAIHRYSATTQLYHKQTELTAFTQWNIGKQAKCKISCALASCSKRTCHAGQTMQRTKSHRNYTKLYDE